MNVREALADIIRANLKAEEADADLVVQQLGGMPLSWLCDMSESVPEYVDNRAVFSAGPYRYALVLWREEYKPQPIERRHDRYAAAPAVVSDIATYRCPITGQPITSRSKHRDNLKRHGCEVAEPAAPKKPDWQQEKREDFSRKKAVYDAMQQLNYH